MILSLEILSLCLIAIMCYLCTKSDLKDGYIYNKVLVIFLVLALLIDIVYYGVFVRDIFIEFIINFLIVSCLSLFLFFSHSFAGGDCKLMIVIALLFPARYYWVIGNLNFTLFFIIVFSILVGYFYLLGNSVWSLLTKKVSVSIDYIKRSLLNFAKSYISAMIYLSLFNYFLTFLGGFGIFFNIWFMRLLCLLVALCIGKYEIFKNKILFSLSAIILLVISFINKTLPFSLELENYFLVLFLLLCQMTINTTIYETIKIDQLKKGMILTTFSSMLMQNSITKGLPKISTEDLKSRLTNEHIESIKIWAKATHTESLTIVKKIPFAIFISVGVVLYIAMWGIL